MAQESAVMGVWRVSSAVTVGRIVAVSEWTRQMIEELNGEVATPVVQTAIVLPDYAKTISMEGSAGMTGLMSDGGVAKVSCHRVDTNYFWGK